MAANECRWKWRLKNGDGEGSMGTQSGEKEAGSELNVGWGCCWLMVISRGIKLARFNWRPLPGSILGSWGKQSATMAQH
ncbi:hypothetical protein V6N13_142412 [Hibiscus sabdariffa]